MKPPLPTRLRAWLIAGALSITLLPLCAAPLTAQPPVPRGWITLESPGATNQVHVLESSEDLMSWRESAILHDTLVRFADVTASGRPVRYFRLNSRTRTAEDDGKNAITLQQERFANLRIPASARASTRLRWIKFIILRDDPTRVWFQDSLAYPFHYDFARRRLARFSGMTAAEFDRHTLYNTDSLAVLGAVLLGTSKYANEYGIQFTAKDPIPREEVARWFDLVRAAIIAPPGSKALYIPTYEQSGFSEEDRAWFSSVGIEPASASRWRSGDLIYSDGWAIGRLSFVPASQISAAYADGRLRPTDILLTEAVPAELPPVSGILTLTPGTPNSHVAIHAAEQGVPFFWFTDPAARDRAMSLAGREVAVRVSSEPFIGGITLLDVEGQLTPEDRRRVLANKQIAPLKYPPKQHAGVLAIDAVQLTPDDAARVGGKAAHYGILRRTLPDQSRPAIALTLDLWDAFLDQSLPEGRTLRQAIETFLANHSQPPDISRLRADLEEIRRLITDSARFSEPLRSAILDALIRAGFNGPAKIRFRSSSNVEDGDGFTGAGLYDSFSGCILDDLDDDSTGPCRCDPDETKERGVFRAIQKVYASFYNENAVLERFRRGVRESEVGMAVLVHLSFPDSEEWANGVAITEYRGSNFGATYANYLVTQVGALSVSNPDSAAQPEIMWSFVSGAETSFTRVQSSSLVPLGGRVLTWDSDYRDLTQLLTTVTDSYASNHPPETQFMLGFEYKRMKPGVLQIKQVRPLPLSVDTVAADPLVLNEPTDWVVFEGEYQTAMEAHRARSVLQFSFRPWFRDPEGLASAAWTNASFEFFSGTNRVRLAGPPDSWPGYSRTHINQELATRWAWGEGAGRVEFELRQKTTPDNPATHTSRWLSPRDFRTTLTRVETGFVPPRTNTARLVPRPTIDSESLVQNRAATNASRTVSMVTRFFWPKVPEGPVVGYTAPNLGFEETRLAGLTTVPVILRDPAAQTYVPSHHNFTEFLVFEPARDPAVPAAQIAELEAQGIRRIKVILDPPNPPVFTAYDAEENARVLK